MAPPIDRFVLGSTPVYRGCQIVEFGTPYTGLMEINSPDGTIIDPGLFCGVSADTGPIL